MRSSIERLLAKAREVGGPAIVFTFDPHPVRLLRPESAPPPLTWTDRKAQLLDELGVTAVIAYPTDEGLLQLSPEEFFRQIVQQKLAGARHGRRSEFFLRPRPRRATSTRSAGCAMRPAFRSKSCSRSWWVPSIVSSSRVREAIQAGDVDLARQLLTRPYRLRGMVTHGAGRGGKIGFPTANLDAIDTLLPAHGVYAARAIAPAGNWPAAVNIGPNPTFGEQALKVEVHLIGFAGSLYGQPLEVDFLSRLRSIRPFESVEALKAQLAHDVAAAREIAQREPGDDEDAVG